MSCSIKEPKNLKWAQHKISQPGRCDTRCSPTPYRLTLFDRTPLNDDLWIIFFIMMASGAPLARFFCDTPHSAYTKAIVIHSVNKTHFLLFRKQFVFANMLIGRAELIWDGDKVICMLEKKPSIFEHPDKHFSFLFFHGFNRYG